MQPLVIKLNKLLIAVLITATLFSCDKDTATTSPGTIAAQTTPDVAYGTDAKQKMDIYLPANRSVTTTKVLVLIHGGAWFAGDKSDFSASDIDSLKKRLPDYAIFNINYRLAAFPATNIFPTQEQDVKAAVAFIYGNRSTYLVSDKFVLFGGSAGAHLALLHAYKNSTPVKIKAVVDFFGPTDMADLYNNPGTVPAATVALLFNGATPTTNLAVYQGSSPLTYATAAAACPTIILQGDLDLLVNATRQSRALQTKLTAAGVVNQYEAYPTLGHGPWDLATNIGAFDKVKVFLTANVQ